MDVYAVVFACPNTGRAVPTGHELPSLDGFAFVGLLAETCRCPHCDETHTWRNRDAWPERQNASRVHMPATLTMPKVSSEPT